MSHCMWGPLALGPAGSDPMSAAPTSADPVPREREEDDDGCDWWGRGRGEEQMRRPTTVAYLYLPPS